MHIATIETAAQKSLASDPSTKFALSPEFARQAERLNDLIHTADRIDEFNLPTSDKESDENFELRRAVAACILQLSPITEADAQFQILMAWSTLRTLTEVLLDLDTSMCVDLHHAANGVKAVSDVQSSNLREVLPEHVAKLHLGTSC